MEETRYEQRKRRTRQLLIETALRLFAEQGYEQTTVAQIAAAADVATKTFFNHFPSKEDVVFADTRQRNTIPLQVIAERQPEDTVADLLTRSYQAMRADYQARGGEQHPTLMRAYTRLVLSVPNLQAKALHQVYDLQREVASALHEAFPDQLDPIKAAAVVGCLVGATQAAALTSLELGQSEDEFWAAMRCGLDTGLSGLRT
ncbi:TetR/AcrR family transcriptional regulator [Amycolatopsis ultiminotia]|uniref:TetR/AcrR family transcriptional regulator n=1 Tax=Amycolatopsis ultiminotia TaxID=543629 RepID=UPI0031EACC30